MPTTCPRPPLGVPLRSRRAWLAVVLTALLGLVGVFGTAQTAAAASASGPDGQQVTVTPSDGLNPAGQRVTVSGSGFDVAKGIYVGICVDNGPGRQPSPCIGGVDMEGAGGTSAWISSNPPAYGEGLAQPFQQSGGQGSFSTTLHVTAADAFADCLDPAVAPRGCVIGTRADHTRSGDRSADVYVPVTFGGSSGGQGGSDAGDDGTQSADGAESDAAGGGALAETGAPLLTAGIIAAVLLLAGAVALIVVRRRSTPRSRE
ncbi:MAG TPA: hypothetical protein VK024_00855 [Actinomycetaceae bacterium]|nr:hypothetical protein [Actinomycetaceae bacterium]